MGFDWQEQDNEYWSNTEELFQTAWDNGDNDTVWKCVNRVALASVKQKLVGLTVPEEEIEEMAMDVTIIAIDRMKRKGKCKKLTSYLYWIVVGVVWNPKKVIDDRAFNIDKLMERAGEKYQYELDFDDKDNLEMNIEEIDL